MTRDIGDRLRLFGARRLDVRRMALNMDQVEQYDPPPNPAKESDSRFADYQANYGDESWELDALEPTVLAKLVTDELDTLIDFEKWNRSILRENTARAELRTISVNYEEVAAWAKDNYGIAIEDDEESTDDAE